MKNLFKFISILLIIAGINGTLTSQPMYYNANANGTNNSFPFNITTGKRVQLLYNPGVLNLPTPAPSGTITSIAFRIGDTYPLGPWTYTNLTIKMGQTNITGFTSGAFYAGTLTTVYFRASVTLQAAGATWLTITLDTPFAYNNTQSLVVDVEQCGVPGAVGFSMCQVTTATNCRIYSGTTSGCPQVYGGIGAVNYAFGINLVVGPAIVTMPATNISAVGATLNGTCNAGNLSSTVSFEYGTTIAYGNTVAGVPPTITGNTVTPFSAAIAGLLPNTLYHFRAKGTNANGTAYGIDRTFTTLASTITGIITNASNGLPIVGAKVSTIPAGTIVPAYSTGPTGSYGLIIPATGSYQLLFHKEGFKDTIVPAATYNPTNAYVVNMAMLENTNPPSNVSATLNTAQTQVTVNWGLPSGNYELLYDDGIQDNFSVWASSGNYDAVKFTPVGYPATVLGGTINIGNSNNYPGGSNPFVPFEMYVYDATGAGGTPGTQLGGPYTTTPVANQYGWITLQGFPGSGITIASGSFYLVMKQLANYPNVLGVAIDTTTIQLRSYQKFGSTIWVPISGNFLLRAIVNGPGGPVPLDAPQQPATITASSVPQAMYTVQPGIYTGIEGSGTVIPLPSGTDNEVVTGYQVWRLLQGQEATPGLWTSIGSTTSTTMTDNSWPSLPCDPYRWGVKTQYTGNRWSDASFSNVIGKCWTANVTVNVTLSCAADSTEGVMVSLVNQAYPDTNYSKVMDASGTVTFANVWKGTYTLTVLGFPYSAYTQTITVLSDQVVDLVLMQVKTPPYGITVDDRSLWSNWFPPESDIKLLFEDWSSSSFTTNQWVVSAGNWSITTAVGNPQPSLMFNWSPTMTNYNCYVTSKNLTGMFSPTLNLDYDIFLNNFSTSTVENFAVEIWDGANWNVLKTYTNTASMPWTKESIDISAYTAKTFKIRFHAYGANSFSINNWNVDNIKIVATKNTPKPNPCILGYNYYLNNVLDGFTQDTSYLIPSTHVHYGTVYNACVLAIYGSGYSTKSCTTFTSHFLYPPTQMNAQLYECSVLVTWHKPALPGDIQVLDVQPRTEFPNGGDYSPVVITTTNNYQYTDNLWDVLFVWTSSQPAAPGIEEDATNVYTASWQSGFGAPPWFHQYNKMTGALVGDFDVPGATAVRDMASWPSQWPFFYGSAATSSLYKMNFTTHTLASTISTGVSGGIRHIAFDPGLDGGNGGFWCGNWTDMYAIRMNGTVLYTGPTQNSCYGDAYDDQSAGGPYIWTHTQSGAHLMDLTQYKIQATPPYLVATGVTHDAGTIPGVLAGTAGGLCTGQVNQKFALIGNNQSNTGNNQVWALEIANWTGGGGTPPGLIGYNVYRDAGLIAHLVPGPDTLHYWDINVNPGIHKYGVSAFYDLTLYGFPGQFDESLPDGPLTVNVVCGRDLPFFEPWDQASFGFQSWTFTNGIQGNWQINTATGNPAPTADFNWQPIKFNYSYALETPTLNAGPWLCANIYLDFDMNLVDRSATGMEKLDVDVFYNNQWHNKVTFSDSGSTNWMSKHYDITSVKGKAFKVRFRAYGANSSDILHWYVDNIHIYGVCIAPTGLAASQSHNNTTLTWTAPECGSSGGGTVMNFIFDDGTAENGWAINPGFNDWLGNEFPISPTYQGVLQQFQVYFMDPLGNTDQTLTLDVFDGTQTLVGTSGPFLAIQDVWININVADIPFSGLFYGMVHWNMQPALSHYLGYDENGPFSGQNLEWYYDGTAFQKLTNLTVANPGVFLLRATALVQGNLKSVVLVPGQQPKEAPYPAKGLTFARGFSDSHNYTTMGAVDGPQGDSTYMMGYNVYRTDSTGIAPFMKLTTAPISALTYMDAIGAGSYGNYGYYVTDVFYTTETSTVLCEASSDTVYIQYPAVGINEVPAGTVTIYPNPATDLVKVSSSYDIRNIQVLNYIGQVVYDRRSVNSKLTQFNVSNFESGVYFVKITTDQGIKTAKVTVTK